MRFFLLSPSTVLHTHTHTRTLTYMLARAHTHAQGCSAILRELAASAHAQNPRKIERQNEGERGEGGSEGMKERRYNEIYRMPTALLPYALAQTHTRPLHGFSFCSFTDLQSGSALLLCVALTVFADLFV